MQRDNFTCVNCGDTENQLHVHHKLYISGNDPWEYTDEQLITLCSKCHKLEHHSVIITENDGITDVEYLIQRLGKFMSCVDEIGNHEGDWTIKLNNSSTDVNIYRFIALLAGFSWFDYTFNITYSNGECLHESNIKIIIKAFGYYYELGHKLNKDNDDFDESIDIDSVYNNVI